MLGDFKLKNRLLILDPDANPDPNLNMQIIPDPEPYHTTGF
jgi:hypothetical protein